MFSSTAPPSTARLFLGAPGVPEGEGGTIEARALNRGFCSPAGLQRRPWLERLRRALDGGLFVLHFQPIVALSDGRISHHEALLRLADEPDGRLLAPALFLPAAERYGMVREIDRMVIDRVTAMLGEEPDPGDGEEPSRIAVNVSALSVIDDGMLAHVQRRLHAHEVDPS